MSMLTSDQKIKKIMDNVADVNGHQGIKLVRDPKTGGSKWQVTWEPEDPLRINDKKIPWEMRYKSFWVDKDKSDASKYYINRITQEPFDDSMFEEYVKEVDRCLNYNIKYYDLDLSKLNKPLIVEVIAEARDGSDSGYGEKELVFEPETILEDMQKEIYYFGFIGGEGGNYFDADYFEIIRNPDKTFSWKEGNGSYSSEDRTFNSRRSAKADAIKTMTPDDGSRMITSTDPDKLFDRIYPQEEEEIPEDVL